MHSESHTLKASGTREEKLEVVMRVAYDISPLVRIPNTGVARVVREVLNRVLRNGHFEVNAVGCFDNDPNPVGSSVRARRWVDRARIEGLRSVDAFRSKTGLAKFLSSVQVDWEQSTQTANRSETWALRAARKLIRYDATVGFAQNQNFDLFFSTFFPPPRWLPSSTSRVLFLYDVIPARLNGDNDIIEIVKRLDEKRDIVVAISDFTKEDFCALTGFSQDRVVVAHLAADESYHHQISIETIDSVLEKYSLKNNNYILSVANPQPRKNLRLLLKSFVEFRRVMPKWDGLLVMAGADRNSAHSRELDEQIASYGGIQNHILRIGPIDETDMPALYCGATAFVFPSLYEGFGLPVLEAMQCGTPVISSNATSLPEIGSDAVLYVDPADVKGLTDALQMLIANVDLQAKLTANGLSQAKKFSWETTTLQVEKAFRMSGIQSKA